MFHVSTYIPLGTGEEKIMERKRHIGNDLTAIVFLDGGGTTKFVPPAISGDFLHSFLIIKPLPGDLFQSVDLFPPLSPLNPGLTIAFIHKEYQWQLRKECQCLGRLLSRRQCTERVRHSAIFSCLKV
jgi:hypothetical protein